MIRAFGLLLVTVALCCGCRAYDDGFLLPNNRETKVPSNASAQKALQRPTDATGPMADRREASRLAPPDEPSNPLAAPTDGASNDAELSEVMSQLLALGVVDPQAQAELMQDLKDTDPKLWPMMIRMYRTAVARHRTKEDTATPRNAPAQAQSMVVNHRPQMPVADGGRVQSRSVAARGPAAVFPDTGYQPIRQIAPPGVNPAPSAPNDNRPPGTLQAPLLTGSTPGAVPLNETAYILEAQRLGGKSTAGTIPPDAPGGPMHAQTRMTARRNTTALASYDQEMKINDWRSHLTSAIKDLQVGTNQLPGTTADVAQHAQLRLLQLVAGQRDEALSSIPGIPASEQDFWTREIYGLATLLDVDTELDPSRRATEASENLGQANRRLREMGTLVVKNLAFCDEVTSYGIYHEFDENTFGPLQEVLLYAEVENFKCDESAKGYHSALRSSYQIIDGQGRPVDEQEYAITEEYCRNARRDFFIRYHVYMPERIFDGEHTLRLTIVDTLSQKIGEASIEFSIEANKK